MAYKLPDDKMINIGVTYVDARGNPAPIDGVVSWASSDETIVTAAVLRGAPSDANANVVPVGKLGQAQITATADADLGTGVTNVITTFDVEVVAGTAISGTITPISDPVPIP